MPPAAASRPSPASGSPTRASCAAMRRSQASASSKPPPSAAPPISASVTSGAVSSRAASRCRRAHQLQHPFQPVRRRDALAHQRQVGAGAEHPARAAQVQHRHFGVGAGGLDSRFDRVDQRFVERVDRRARQREREHARAAGRLHQGCAARARLMTGAPRPAGASRRSLRRSSLPVGVRGSAAIAVQRARALVRRQRRGALAQHALDFGAPGRRAPRRTRRRCRRRPGPARSTAAGLQQAGRAGGQPLLEFDQVHPAALDLDQRVLAAGKAPAAAVGAQEQVGRAERAVAESSRPAPPGDRDSPGPGSTRGCAGASGCPAAAASGSSGCTSTPGEACKPSSPALRREHQHQRLGGAVAVDHADAGGLLPGFAQAGRQGLAGRHAQPARRWPPAKAPGRHAAGCGTATAR